MIELTEKIKKLIYDEIIHFEVVNCLKKCQ